MQKRFHTILAPENRGGNLRPAAGASVTVTDPNGALATIYSDNGVTEAANPLTTSATGYYEYYAADGRYTETIVKAGRDTVTISDILLEDPADSPAPTSADMASTAANKGAGLVGFSALVEYAAGTVGKFLTDLVSSAGSALVGFIQSGTGAVERTVQDKLRESVSVKDFGAVGDGVTDDTAAFVAISGMTAYIPDGEYVLTSNVALNLDTKLIGAGRNSTILHVYGELSWNSTGDMQTGEFTELTIVYHGASKARIVGVNMEFDSFTQNCFLAHRFSIRPASTSDTALFFFDVTDPRQAVFRDFYVDGNYAAASNPVGQVQETVFKTSGTGFGLYVDGYFARDVYRLAYQTGAVEGGHIGCGEVVGCYIGIESDASVPGGWVAGAHINAVHRAIKYTARSHFWIAGLSAFRSPSFYAMEWAAVELVNCSIANIQNLQPIYSPSAHSNRTSAVIANGCTGVVLNGAQGVEVGKNGGAFLELIGTTGVDARACIGTACDQTLSADAGSSKAYIDIFARTGTGATSSAGSQIYIKDVAPSNVVAPAGTSSAPGMTFVGEADCGFYIPLANNVGMAAGGVEVARLVPAGSANRVDLVSGAAGVAPRVRARGTDADIDLELGTVGNGSIKVGYGSLVATTPGSFSAARYLRIKDSSGATYYLPLAAAPW